MSAGRDPVEEWRDVSRRAALATGYRPRSRAVARPTARLAIGATAALVLLVVVGGLAMRGRPTTLTPAGPVVASAEDARFRLELTTPRAQYSPEDAIEPVASATYLGPRARETISHAMYPIGFQIKEVGGERLMGGGMREPCLQTELAKGEAAVVPFSKAGKPDDPKGGFDLAWYKDPILRLPEGTWQIVAYLDVYVGGCGGERHQLTVENIIRVVKGDAAIPTPSASPDGPVIATAEDASFRLGLTTPRAEYGPDDAIEPVASVTYLGPQATETMFHAAYPIGFRIEEVGGPRLMGGGMDLPCLTTELTKGGSAVLPFAKAGSPDDPKGGFDRAWYEDPVLRLPAGTWRIIAYLDVFLGDCGGERHQLTVENEVHVVAGDASPAAATPSTSLSAEGAQVLEIVRKYEDAIATDHPEVAWPMLSPWSRTTVGSSTTFADAERRARQGESAVKIADPSRDPALLAAAVVGERAADVAATADADRVYVLSVRHAGSDAVAASTVNLVVAPLLGGEWRIWLDTTPGTYGAWPLPEGCAAFGLSPRRCEAVVAAAASNIGVNRSTATAISLMAEPGCGFNDPSSDVINICTRTMSFVAGVRFEVAEAVTRTDVFCGVGPPTLVCSESPGLQALDLHNAGFWDLPCPGEPPAGCATPLPPPSAADAVAGRELRIDALDVPVGPVGHREVEIGTAVLPNGILTEATFRIVDESQVGFLIDPGVVRMELRSSEPGRPAFDNIYSRGVNDGPEEVRVFLIFDVVETSPSSVVRVADVLVR